MTMLNLETVVSDQSYMFRWKRLDKPFQRVWNLLQNELNIYVCRHTATKSFLKKLCLIHLINHKLASNKTTIIAHAFLVHTQFV